MQYNFYFIYIATLRETIRCFRRLTHIESQQALSFWATRPNGAREIQVKTYKKSPQMKAGG